MNYKLLLWIVSIISIPSIYVLHLILKFWYLKRFRIFSYTVCGFSLFVIIAIPLLYKTQTEKLISQRQNKETDYINIIRNDYLFNKENHEISYSNPNRDNKKTTNFQSPNTLHQKLIKINYKVFKYINSDMKCKFLDFYISLISYCDSKKFNIGFILILIISIGILWNNKKDCFGTMLTILASVLAAGVILTHILKYYFKSPRPLTIFGYGNINIMYETSHTSSFPSGHTQIAFSICTFMFIIVRKYWYLYIILSLGVAFERIYSGNHFPFDVLIGAATGTFSAFIVVNLLKK